MKKAILSIFVLLSSVLSFAQHGDALKQFVSRIDGARLKFSYSFSSGLQTKMTGKGDALVQADCFYVNGNGLEIYCDGKCAWTMDREAKEVIIESLEEDSGDYVNPALLVSSIEKAYKCVSQTPASYAGKSSVKVVMTPRRSSDLVKIVLMLAPDGSALYGASLFLSDGNVTDFTVSNFAIQPKSSANDFKLDVAKLDRAYLITDLR